MDTTNPTEDVGEKLKKILNGQEALFPVNLCARYPQIAEKISTYWLEPGMLHNYFSELLTSTRENRAGFPPEIHREIFNLSTYYSTLHPKKESRDDFWNGLYTG